MSKGPEVGASNDILREQPTKGCQRVPVKKKQENESKNRTNRTVYKRLEAENHSLGKGKSLNYFKESKYIAIFVVQKITLGELGG